MEQTMHIKKSIFTLILSIILLGAAVAGCSTEKPMPGATAGTFVDDSYLTSAIKAKLVVDTGLKAFDIKVITDHQVVTLSGTVPTSALRDQAVTVAKSVSGVKDVISKIEVKSTP
jgi:hyperosmotically inducible protein